MKTREQAEQRIEDIKEQSYQTSLLIRNLEDERAPLADEYTWGFVADQHSDYGKSYSLELYKNF